MITLFWHNYALFLFSFSYPTIWCSKFHQNAERYWMSLDLRCFLSATKKGELPFSWLFRSKAWTHLNSVIINSYSISSIANAARPNSVVSLSVGSCQISISIAFDFLLVSKNTWFVSNVSLFRASKLDILFGEN